MERETQEKKRAVAAKKRVKKRQNKKEKQEKEKIPTTIKNSTPESETDIQGKDEVIEDMEDPIRVEPPMATVTSTIGQTELDDACTLEKMKSSDRDIGKLGDNKHENQGIAPGLSSPMKGIKEEEGWTEVKKKKMSKQVQVSSSAISRVIGHRGCIINNIRELSGAHIKIEKQKGNDGVCKITIKGSPEGTKQAHDLIMSCVSDPEKKLYKLITKYTNKPPQQKEYFRDDTSISTSSTFSSSISSSSVTSSLKLTDGGSSVSRSLTNTNEQLATLQASIGAWDGPPNACTINSPRGSQQKSLSSIPSGLNMESKKDISSSNIPLIPQEMEAQRTNNFVGMQPVGIRENNQSSNHEHPHDTQMMILDFPDQLGPKKEDERKKWESGSERNSRTWDTDEERYVHDPDEKKILNPQKGTARNWLKQAKLDLKSGKVLMQGIEADPYQGYNSVCLLCHAAVELAVKSAMYATNANDVKQTHVFSDNIPETDQRLFSLCFKLKNVVKHINIMRYPDNSSIPSDRYFENHATEALSQSEEILKYISETYF